MGLATDQPVSYSVGGHLLACLYSFRSFAGELRLSLSYPLGISRLLVAWCEVALVELEHIFLEELAVELEPSEMVAVVGLGLGSMGSEVVKRIVAQRRKLVRRMDFAEELIDLVFTLELVEERRLAVVELLVFAEQLVFELGQCFSLLRLICFWLQFELLVFLLALVCSKLVFSQFII